jgi:hypothetical protein
VSARAARVASVADRDGSIAVEHPQLADAKSVVTGGAMVDDARFAEDNFLTGSGNPLA